MGQLTTVKLYGHLGEKFGKEFKFSISSTSEAVKALTANLPGFRNYIAKHGEAYHIFVDDKNIGQDELVNPTSQRGIVIKIVPAVIGSGGFFKVILGIALIAVSFFVPAIATSIFGSIFRSLGFSLLFGGIAEAFFSPPKDPQTSDEKLIESSQFNGAINTAGQGAAVPVGYGRLIVGSAVISAGLTVEQL